MKKFYTLIELIIALVIGMILLGMAVIAIVWGCIFFFGAKAIQEVNENGAKQSIERIWEGPESDSQVSPSKSLD